MEQRNSRQLPDRVVLVSGNAILSVIQSRKRQELMGRTADDIYDEWDLSPIQMPLRSTLDALKPIGVGTAFVESLTSYLTRLAEAHGVFPGILVNKMIAPQGQRISPHRGRQTLFMTDGRKSHLLNATGIRASRLVQILGTLTSCSFSNMGGRSPHILYSTASWKECIGICS